MPARSWASKQVIIGNSSNDQVKETELINTYVSQGVKGIAIAPLSPTVSIDRPEAGQ